VSFCVTCADQAEVDYYWEALLDGGGEPSVCGWLKDRYGVRWQVVPTVFYAMVRDEDQARKARVTKAMLSMVKFDIPALEAAYAGA
jgi:predicted 3-demethylubiquinone-9 3-methyltransferase (glyoxalase superfamily)